MTVIPRHRQQLAQHIMYTPRHQLIICLSHKVCWKLNKILRSTVQIKLGLSADVLRQTKCYCELLSLCRAVQLSGSVSAAQWQCYRLMFPRSLISQLCFVTRCGVCRGSVVKSHHKFMLASYMMQIAEFLALLHHNASFFNFCIII